MFFEVLDPSSAQAISSASAQRKRARPTSSDEEYELENTRAPKRPRTGPAIGHAIGPARPGATIGSPPSVEIKVEVESKTKAKTKVESKKAALDRSQAGLANTMPIGRMHFWQALENACSSKNRHLSSAEYKDQAQSLHILDKFDKLLGMFSKFPVVKTTTYSIRASTLYGGSELVIGHKTKDKESSVKDKSVPKCTIFQNIKVDGMATRGLLALTAADVAREMMARKTQWQQIDYIFSIVSAMVKFAPVWEDMLESANAIPKEQRESAKQIDFSEARFQRFLHKSAFDDALVQDGEGFEAQSQSDYGPYTVIVGS